jgi:hypothetical protein
MTTVAELEQEADRCKMRFEARVEQIRRRLMPERIADEVLRALKLPGRTATEAVVDTALRNPFLVLGLAAGAGWLFVSARQTALRASKRARSSHKRMKEIAHGYGNR